MLIRTPRSRTYATKLGALHVHRIRPNMTRTEDILRREWLLRLTSETRYVSQSSSTPREHACCTTRAWKSLREEKGSSKKRDDGRHNIVEFIERNEKPPDYRVEKRSRRNSPPLFLHCPSPFTNNFEK